SRFISLESGSAQARADLLADRAPKMGKNPIILNGENRSGPAGPKGPSDRKLNQPSTAPTPGTPNGTNAPVVRPMWAPNPLPDQPKQPGGPMSQSPPAQSPLTQSEPLVRGRDVRMVRLSQIADPAPEDAKPIYIDVIGNRLRITSDDPIALQRMTDFARFVVREGDKPNDNLFEVIPLKNVSAEDAAKVLTEAFNGPQQPQQQQLPGGLADL